MVLVPFTSADVLTFKRELAIVTETNLMLSEYVEATAWQMWTLMEFVTM